MRKRRKWKKKAERLTFLDSKLAIKLQCLRQYGHKWKQMNAQDPETDSYINGSLIYDNGVLQNRKKLKLRKQLGVGHRLAPKRTFRNKKHHFRPRHSSECPSPMLLSTLYIFKSLYLPKCENQLFMCLQPKHTTCCLSHSRQGTELSMRGPTQAAGNHLQ